MQKAEELLKQLSKNLKKASEGVYFAKANKANLLARKFEQNKESEADVLSADILQYVRDRIANDQELQKNIEALTPASELIYIKKPKDNYQAAQHRTFSVLKDADGELHVFVAVKSKNAAGVKPENGQVKLERGATKTRKIVWDVAGEEPVPYASLSYDFALDNEKAMRAYERELEMTQKFRDVPGFLNSIPHLRLVTDEAGKAVGYRVTIYSKFRPASLMDLLEGKWPKQGVEEDSAALKYIKNSKKVKFADIDIEEYKVDIMLQLINIIKQLREKGIEHKDIKPENILVHYDASKGKFVVELIDFGEALKFGQKDTARGSLAYMDPIKLLRSGLAGNEGINDLFDSYKVHKPFFNTNSKSLVSDEDVASDGSHDIYAIGKIFYRMMYGDFADYTQKKETKTGSKTGSDSPSRREKDREELAKQAYKSQAKARIESNPLLEIIKFDPKDPTPPNIKTKLLRLQKAEELIKTMATKLAESGESVFHAKTLLYQMRRESNGNLGTLLLAKTTASATSPNKSGLPPLQPKQPSSPQVEKAKRTSVRPGGKNHDDDDI